jgi:hypothetical protein
LISGALNISPEEKSKLSRLGALKAVENGTHNFLGGQIQKRAKGTRIAGDNNV